MKIDTCRKDILSFKWGVDVEMTTCLLYKHSADFNGPVAVKHG